MTVPAETQLAAPDNSNPAWRQAASGQLPVTDLFTMAQQLVEQGQAPLAIALYQLWLEKTDSPLAYAVCFNLAVTLSNTHDERRAEQLYRRAIELNAHFIEPRLNLGTLLERAGRPDEALDAWRAVEALAAAGAALPLALRLQALNNRGRLLELQKRLAEAEAVLAASLRLDAAQPNVITHWVHLRQKQCAWPVYSGLEQIPMASLVDGTSALATLSASDDPARQLAAARRFVADKVDATLAPLSGPHGYGHARLRIGYLSSDFCSHAVSILTAELYELHDRASVEVYGFCWSHEDGSPLRARVVRAMDHYVRIADMDDAAAARCIRAHEIDILVDLHGLTLGARPTILAYRPAPVQMTYLGFPGPTALPGIDYVIADEFVLPPETAAFFTEKPLYMPDTFQINDRQRVVGPRPQRADCGLPPDAFVFCSFNNNFKFTPEVFASWMAILQRVPGSVLWLVADHDIVRSNLWAQAEAAGVARERLIFAGRALPAAYLARYQLADLFLDTYPFNAGTTASDALWAGLPVLTRSGATFASRMAGSLLRACGLAQLITTTPQEYEELAVQLALQPRAIDAMKQTLAENRMTCALFDSPRLVRHLEAAYRRVAAPAAPAPAAADADVAAMAAMAASSAAIPVVTVSYNSPDLIAALLTTLRRHYANKVYVIDGSRPEIAAAIKAITDGFDNVEFIPFGYNIHHGPGMAWAIQRLGLSGPVLFLDSDVEIVRAGFLESLLAALTPELYGVGSVHQVTEQGYDRADGAVPYLHPACMLCNIDVMRRWPLPIKHGAPLVATMLALHQAGASALLRHMPWVHSDFGKSPERIFIKHDWQGTVIRTGGYHYDLPTATHDINQDLLAFVPGGARKLVEVGCGDGAFAKAYKALNPICNYTGIEAGPAAEQARAHCDFVFRADVEQPDPIREAHVAGADCWILGEVLERLDDPWTLLAQIRASLAPGGSLVLAVRNFQHWSNQVRLNLGDLRYQPGGALDKAERRLYTRGALLDMLADAGFRVSGGMPRVRDEPGRAKFLPALRQLAEASGNDPDLAEQDALAWQYIISAVPA